MDRLIRWMRHAAWADLLELVLVAMFAVGLAHWTWLAATPRVAGAPTALADVADAPRGALVARHLFGAARAEGAAAGSASVATGFTLLGVFSGREPGAGRAILGRQGSRPVSVAVGEEIAEGVELQEVHPDHVIILRGGVLERVELERLTPRAAPQPAPASAPVRK